METDLFMYRGDDRTWTMTATVGGAPLNLTGATIEFTAKEDPAGPSLIFRSTSGLGITITDAANGVFTVNIVASQTTGFTEDKSFVWDIEITIGGFKRTLPEDASGRPTYGKLKIKSDLTI